MFSFPSIYFLHANRPNRAQAATPNTQAVTEIELQAPEPAYFSHPRRDIRAEQQLSIDEFLRAESQETSAAANHGRHAFLVTHPSNHDEFFRRLDDVEAQTGTLQFHQEPPPPFDQPPTYDEAVPAPQYKAGFKQNLKRHGGLIATVGTVLTLMALTISLSITVGGRKAASPSNGENTH